MTLLTAFALAALFTPQTPDPPQPAFEVASVRPSAGQLLSVKFTPGRLVVKGASLADLIEEAWGISAVQVVGVPLRARYVVEAKAEGTPSRSAMRAMLQTLLAERFQLKLHRETRELPITALVLRKNAWKGTPAAMPDSDPQLGFSGNRGDENGRSIFLNGESVTLPFVAKFLCGRLNRMVLDRTGLEGAFDFKAEVPVDAERAADRTVSERQLNEEITTDLVERLGLKLEQRREMVEVIVVDHAEQPSPN